MFEDKLKRLKELYPAYMEYEQLKKEVSQEAVENNIRHKDEDVAISLASRKTYTCKYPVEVLKDLQPMAVVVKTEEVIDMDLLKSLPDYDKYIDVKETNFATIKFAKKE